MTKEEKIQEAYGEYWEKVKLYVSENGWLDAKSFYKEATHKGLEGLTMDVSDPYDPKYCYYKRPVSLNGIENNNGWIKIQSVEDLPKEGVSFWVIKKGYDYPLYEPMYHDDGEYWIEWYTHYQPIKKPKPPIY